MMKKRDLRVQKTYMSLTDAMLRLLRKKKFEEITINELCDEAMIRRATFYKHFGDKYEFIQFMIEEMRIQFLSEFEQRAQNAKEEDYFEILVSYVIDFLLSYEDIIHSLESSSLLSLLLNIRMNDSSGAVEQEIADLLTKYFKTGADPIFATQYLLGGIIPSILWWLPKRDEIPREEVTKQLVYLMKQTVR